EWRGYHYRIELYGTNGYIRFGYPPMHLIHGVRATNGKVRRRRYVFPAYQVLERFRGWEWGLVESLARELEAWAGAISSGVDGPASGRDGLEAVRIAHAAQRVADQPGSVAEVGVP